MSGIIDAHVHIVPPELLGTLDERFGVSVLPFGVKLGPMGKIQFMPPYIENSAFSPSALISLMDSAGVEKAVIMQSLSNSSNESAAQAVSAFPDRLKAAMVIEPKDEKCLSDILYWHGRGLTVMKFETSEGLGYTHPNAYPQLRFNTPLFYKIFELAEELNISVTIDPGRIGSKCYTPEIFREMACAFPKLKLIICHLGFPYIGIENDSEKFRQWTEMTELAALPNVWFDTAALPDLFDSEGYPYQSGLGFLRSFLNRFPGKAIWGSDIPGTLCRAAYPQMADMFLRSSMFTDSELNSLFTEAAVSAYSL